MEAGMDPDSELFDKSKWTREPREKMPGGIGPCKWRRSNEYKHLIRNTTVVIVIGNDR